MGRRERRKRDSGWDVEVVDVAEDFKEGSTHLYGGEE